MKTNFHVPSVSVMKKLLVLILAVSIALGLCSCKARNSVSAAQETQKGVRDNVVVSENPMEQDAPSSSDSEPEPESEPDDDSDKAKATAEEFLEAVKTGSKDKIQPYLDYNTLFRITAEQNAEWQFNQILPMMTWEIFSAKADGDGAIVSVKISNADMGLILQQWLDKVQLLEYDNALLDEPLDREALDARGKSMFASLLGEYSGGRVEKLVDIKLQKDGDAWKPQPDSELADALLGRYFSAYTDKAGGMWQSGEQEQP